MVKTTLTPHNVALTPAQIRKLVGGKTTLLKHEQMNGGDVQIHLNPKKLKKLMKNHAAKKGYKLSLSQEEIEGGNLRSFLGKVGKTVKNVAKKVAPAAKRIAKAAAPALAGMAATAIGQPQLAPIAAIAAKAAVGGSFKPVGRGVKLENTYNTFLNSQHPAQNPILPQRDQSLHPSTFGGSFRTVGGSFMPVGGSLLGTPMSPLLPQGDFSLPRKV